MEKNNDTETIYDSPERGVMKTKEVWKVVPDYPKYKASNRGRILGAKGFPLKGHPDKDGYLRVSLVSGKKIKTWLIHRIVYGAFCGLTPGKQINHKDGNKTNNLLHNLEEVTHGQNQKHAYDFLGKKGPIGELNGRVKLNNEKIPEILGLLKKGFTQQEIATRFGLDQSTISYIKSGKLWNSVTNRRNKNVA